MALTSATTPIHVTVKFNDVLDLVPQSAVKVDDISVGRIEDIKVDGYTADVSPCCSTET